MNEQDILREVEQAARKRWAEKLPGRDLTLEEITEVDPPASEAGKPDPERAWEVTMSYINVPKTMSMAKAPEFVEEGAPVPAEEEEAQRDTIGSVVILSSGKLSVTWDWQD